MAQKTLSSLAVSVFCENMAMMLAAGIGNDEAVALLCEDTSESIFNAAADALHKELLGGESLSAAVTACGYFPKYVSQMITAGESAGRTESVLRSLAVYYESQSRLESKLKSAVVYPVVLLVLMTAILGFLQAKVLPVFTGVYESLAGNLAQSSYGYIQIGQAVSWAALGVTLALSACLLAAGLLSLTAKGRAALVRMLEHLPLTRRASESLAWSRFTNVLSIFTASGVDADTAMAAAGDMVTHVTLTKKIDACKRRMADGMGLASAVFEERLFEPLYGRMLLSASRSGQLENTLGHLAEIFSADADAQIDKLVDTIEPALSGFLTVAVGVTLLAVMLPLIGILGGIG